MAVAYRGAGALSKRTGQNTTALTPALPAGTAAGDLLILNATTFKSPGDSTIDTPSGWTLIDQSAVWDTHYRSAVFWKIAGASEPSPSVTTATACFLDAAVLGFTGCDATTPIDAALTWAVAAPSTSVNVPAITTVTANAWRLLIVSNSSQNSNSSSFPSGWTQRWLDNTGNTTGYVADTVLVAAAGTAAATSCAIGSGATATIEFALRESGGAGGGATFVPQIAILG